MPRKPTIPDAAPDVIELFWLSFVRLEGGTEISCPAPLPQARKSNVTTSNVKEANLDVKEANLDVKEANLDVKETKAWGGSTCYQVFKPKHRAKFTSHAIKAHGIPANITTTGPWLCKFPHPLTKIRCGYRFKRLSHLKRHQGGGQYGRVGKSCAAYTEKADHLLGCDHVFENGRICGRSFKQTKLLKRHKDSIDHGGLGARAKVLERKEMAAQARRLAAEDEDGEEEEMEVEEEKNEMEEGEQKEDKKKLVEEVENEKEEDVDDPSVMVDDKEPDPDQNEACDVDAILSRYHEILFVLPQ